MNTKKSTLGDSGRYTRVTGTRKTARLAMYGSPAVKRSLKDISYVDVKLMHTFEEISLNPLILQQLRNYDNYNVQKLGMEEVARQVAEFKKLFENLRIAAALQMLRNGAVYYDGNGNLLPSSSGAIVTVSAGMNANNQNQLNGIITQTWEDVTTDIPLQLRTLKQRARRLTGYSLKYAFYGENVPTYLTDNDKVQDYLSRNPGVNSKFVDSAELPDGLFGLTWIPVYESFFEDSADTNQSIWGADAVVFTPEVSADWWEVMEGTYMVPNSLNIVTDASAAMGNLSQVTGMFGYGALTHNPPTICMYSGDTHLPIIKVPDSVFSAVTANY